MKKDENGKWEEIVRSKLYDFESSVNPDDWDVISGKLPDMKITALHSYRKYIYAVAAVAALLLIVGGLYFYSSTDNDVAGVSAVVDKKVLSVEKSDKIVEKTKNNVDKSVEKPAKTVEKSVCKAVEKVLVASSKGINDAPSQWRDSMLYDVLPMRLESKLIENVDMLVQETLSERIEDIDFKDKKFSQEKPLVADASSEIKKHRRRWGFGMGGGNFAGISSSGGATLVPSNSGVYSNPVGNSEDYMFGENVIKLRSVAHAVDYKQFYNSVSALSYNAPLEIEHKTPISLGVGVSYYLNDRWSLQSGLTYTLLRSEWKGVNAIGDDTKTKQKLYYIGIPLSAVYKIAEWKKFRFYAIAGGMVEKNIAGSLKNTTFVSEGLPTVKTENLHMKELMCSLNARAGISYPVWKFINVYAEGGCSYYFDNKSYIKTIRSDKPFNVSLQTGISLGF